MHRAVPDWGETQARGPSSSSPKLDDEAIARQLQQQYDREVNGIPGGVSSLEEDSVTVARRLQACTVLCSALVLLLAAFTGTDCFSSHVHARHSWNMHVCLVNVLGVY